MEDISADMALGYMGDLIDAIGTPYIILPSQLNSRSRILTGEQKLLLRLLEHAVESLNGHQRVDKRSLRNCEWEYLDTVWWFEHPDSGHVTLEMCCGALGLDVVAVQDGIRKICHKREKGESLNGNGSSGPQQGRIEEKARQEAEGPSPL